MDFGVSEYTLVFRRVMCSQPDADLEACGWALVRPALRPTRALAAGGTEREVEQVLTVRICSTLGLDDAAYERFLLGGEIPRAALRLVARVRLADARSVEMTRRKIQSLVMGAEVRFIADALSA